MAQSHGKAIVGGRSRRRYQDGFDRAHGAVDYAALVVMNLLR